MAGEFTVKILQPEEFEKLPFKRIQENPGAVMGAADKKNRIAYVRDTGFNDFTKANIGHELDELMQSTSPHEEDGIRYKDFSQSFGNFLGNIPVIGKGASALGRFAGSGIDKLGSMAGSPFNIGNQSAGQSAGNLFSAPSLVGSDQGGRALSGIPDIKSGTSFPGFGSGFGSSIANFAGKIPSAIGSIAGGGGGFPSFGGSGRAPSFVDQMFSGAKGFFTGSPAGKLLAGKNPAGGSGSSDSFGESLGKSLPGAGIALLGNLFAPKVDAPDFGGVRDSLAGRIGEGNSPAFDLGFGEASRILGSTPGQVPQELFDSIDLRKQDAITALEDRFRSNQQSGGLSESDTSQFGRLRAQIEDQFEREKAALEFDFRNQQQAERIETMKTVLNLDTAQFNQYAKLAELDVAQLMIQTGIDVQTANEFKQLFGNIGGQMISSANA